jgi:UDP-N-acetyl-2-amino-2-deoxyglucuronate dehydrogenase
MRSKNFALIGAAGYIAPRHMQAIRDTGNELVAALDKNDSVGIIDKYFPEADFFTEFERFDRHLEKLKRKGLPINFVSICSPNYLHDAHIRFGLRIGANVICEKPLVLNPWNARALEEIETETGFKIFTILQLRLHPNVIRLRKMVESDPGKMYDVKLTYITSRGKWYYASWKGDENKSGGIATNIGIHFFDMLTWVFGPVQENVVHIHTHDRATGYLVLPRARVKWFLSINSDTLPPGIKEKNQGTYRSLRIGNEDFDFSENFTELHTKSYEAILSGKGFGIKDAFHSVKVVHDIRKMKPAGLVGEYHELAELEEVEHPFLKG